MTGIALLMAVLGIVGGVSLIKTSKKIDTTTESTNDLTVISFNTDFYNNLDFFKYDSGKVIAIKKDSSETELYSGVGASEYFKSVQLGYDKWLENHNDNSQVSTDSESKVKFS